MTDEQEYHGRVMAALGKQGVQQDSSVHTWDAYANEVMQEVVGPLVERLRQAEDALTNARAKNADNIADREKMLRDIMAERDQSRRDALHIRGEYAYVAWLYAEAVWQREVIRERGEAAAKTARELRDQLARAVVFPSDWRDQLAACPSSGAGVDLVESWRVPVDTPAAEPSRDEVVEEWANTWDGVDRTEIPLDPPPNSLNERLEIAPSGVALEPMDTSDVVEPAAQPAPQDTAKFKAGDRVEWNPRDDEWERGVVTIAPPKAFFVNVDLDDGGFVQVEPRHCRRVTDGREDNGG